MLIEAVLFIKVNYSPLISAVNSSWSSCYRTGFKVFQLISTSEFNISAI